MRKFINKILDVPKLILRIWLILWACLIILLIMKFCFGIWYPVVSNNEIFNNMCNFVDNNKIVSMIILAFFYIFNGHIIFLTSTGLKKYPKWYYFIIITLILIGMFFIKDFNNALGMICEVMIIASAIIVNLKTCRFKNTAINILLPIIFYILINLWQFTIYFARGLDLQLLPSISMLVYLILQIDYYIFIIISWIGVSFVGIGGFGWLWSKDVTVLKAIREKELKKAKPNQKKIESLDIRIAELKKEGK